MITQERQQPTRLLSWRPLFYPLGNHRGWIMELFHKEGDRYFIQVINCRDFSKITSDPVTFTLNHLPQATAYAKGLIDWDENFSALGQVQSPKFPF